MVSSTITKSDYVPGVHKFLENFINHYMNNKEFRESLMLILVKGCVSKSEGVVNHPYSVKVLEFFLALDASGDQKEFKFLSGNMCGVLLRHIQRLNHKQRTKPFINIDQREIVTRLGKQIASICHRRNEESGCVAFTASIYGAVIVKSYQVYFSHGVVVGGAYPNHYFSID